ncbi:camp-regulated phosphoprotein family protein igo1 [Diplodia corticola]|uniref:mRNA stability protein n=1 Tax=Diplodia corticola TaxID=236234 RepID=A0A1J9R1Q3_9PEZI|nr:camp-regulated phosphoprotein family protein igo1 [Diplodia corticola]OJD34178.1 camp-regulated phosphoprotein family protein igo1 [Diplodia corticola]
MASKQNEQSRQYFDSGDFALSQASEPSNIGTVQTGTEHPTSKTVSHPSAPVPSGGNVAREANDQHRDGRTMCAAPESHLQQQSYDDGAAAGGEKGVK